MSNKMPDKLLGGRLLVKVLKSEEQEMDSGIVIPKTANSQLSEGLVIKIDEAIKEFTPVGNIVVFPTGAGVGQFIGNDPHLWLTVNDIWGTFAIDEE